jgi:hypothetical protein
LGVAAAGNAAAIAGAYAKERSYGSQFRSANPQSVDALPPGPSPKPAFFIKLPIRRQHEIERVF